MQASVSLVLASLGFGVALASSVFEAARLVPAEVSYGGRRGEQRERARSSALFRVLEPWLVLLGGLTERLLDAERAGRRSSSLVARVRTMLVRAGQPAGLGVGEFFVLSLLVGLGAAWLIGPFVEPFLGPFGTPMAGVVGLLLPKFRLEALLGERIREAMRVIPRAMDLASLCMSAGMDFRGAFSVVVDADEGVVAAELRHLLRSLELGLTRRAALLALMERLPAIEVRDFCRAVLQADEKGASLAEALANQARLSRLRRSVRAEESASRAAVLLILPMMLLMAAIVLLLLGPVFVGGFGI